MEKAANLHMQAQQLISNYEETLEMLEKGKEFTDDQIDAMLGSEADLGQMLDALILMKVDEARRRSIAEKQEEKCMIFIKRIMNRLQVDERKSPDGKAAGKIKYRREYKDKEKKTVPLEYMGPVRSSIDSAVQKGMKVEGIEVFEGHLAVQVR